MDLKPGTERCICMICDCGRHKVNILIIIVKLKKNSVHPKYTQQNGIQTIFQGIFY